MEILAYRVEGGDYHNPTKLGLHETKNMAPKVKQMVEAVDRGVGRILAALRENDLDKRTLVVFTSDNGGYLTYQGGFHGISNNGPLRGQKGDVYEGGHRVPAIAWWPGRIRPGVSDEIAMSFDLFPTFAAAAALNPTNSKQLDGVNLLPLLLDSRPIPPRTLFWRMRDHKAVRRGRWKLVAQGTDRPELFDVSAGIGESNDLAAQHPRVAEDLLDGLAAWEGDVGNAGGN